jgi:MOSC domain-containing protein YiiM
LWSWLEEKLQLQQQEQQQPLATPLSTNQEQHIKDKDKFHATVIRTAARNYNATTSKPSSREYTTRKDALFSIDVSLEGAFGDYNHYRTVALKGTPNRAISILTNDVMEMIKSAYPSFQIGDFGENILLQGITFSQLVVGQYEFSSNQNNNPGGVVVEITQHMVPCANLCKLSWINMAQLEAKERIARCQELIDFVDRADGFRGWYAKVLQPGVISVGDSFGPPGAQGLRRNEPFFPPDLANNHD